MKRKQHTLVETVFLLLTLRATAGYVVELVQDGLTTSGRVLSNLLVLGLGLVLLPQNSLDGVHDDMFGCGMWGFETEVSCSEVGLMSR